MGLLEGTGRFLLVFALSAYATLLLTDKQLPQTFNNNVSALGHRVPELGFLQHLPDI
jgi:hypothetical protein